MAGQQVEEWLSDKDLLWAQCIFKGCSSEALPQKSAGDAQHFAFVLFVRWEMNAKASRDIQAVPTASFGASYYGVSGLGAA